MKKIFMTLAAAFVAVSMNAQVYVGGSLGFASVSPEVGDGETTFTLLPEIGYQFSEDWAVGVQVGYASDKVMGVGYVGDLSQWVAVGPSESAFIFAPYARYTALKYKCVNLFFDGGIGFVSGSDAKFSAMNIGIKAAKGDIIIRLDGHALYPNDYFSLIVNKHLLFQISFLIY